MFLNNPETAIPGRGMRMVFEQRPDASLLRFP